MVVLTFENGKHREGGRREVAVQLRRGGMDGTSFGENKEMK